MGGLGAAALQALGKPAAALAASNGNVQLGHGTADTDNNSAAETRVNATADAVVAFTGAQLATGGMGLQGLASDGFGVKGNASTSGNGVVGYSQTGTGVQGYSASGYGLDAWSPSGVGASAVSNTGLASRAHMTDNTPSTFQNPSNKNALLAMAGDNSNISTNTDEVAVYAYCDTSVHSVGVFGESHQGVGAVGIGGIGVVGAGTWGVLGDVAANQIGVYGNTGPNPAPAVTTGIGVLARAESTAQLALRVLGRVSFSRSGRVSFGAGTSSKTITMAGVTTSSFILATPQTNRSGLFVQAVVPGSGKFTIYLNKAVSATTYVGYMVLN
ncbi:MAG TPA: hypothetical protein VF484_08460 [Candidatus Limnocylindrales bacterium]